ncbi:p43 [Hyphantria cunea granulovirus]|uniref:P43 n=1 Tax=Hyphantria cunea granulovirus TaxID=307448 RepID=A0AAE6D0E3_9BBAC|nr:p43 [Hyphantria cunea granulovirus]QBQ01666.1 p43 [Hyphantria cunea granulovirus]
MNIQLRSYTMNAEVVSSNQVSLRPGFRKPFLFYNETYNNFCPTRFRVNYSLIDFKPEDFVESKKNILRIALMDYLDTYFNSSIGLDIIVYLIVPVVLPVLRNIKSSVDNSLKMEYATIFLENNNLQHNMEECVEKWIAIVAGSNAIDKRLLFFFKQLLRRHKKMPMIRKYWVALLMCSLTPLLFDHKSTYLRCMELLIKTAAPATDGFVKTKYAFELVHALHSYIVKSIKWLSMDPVVLIKLRRLLVENNMHATNNILKQLSHSFAKDHKLCLNKMLLWRYMDLLTPEYDSIRWPSLARSWKIDWHNRTHLVNRNSQCKCHSAQLYERKQNTRYKSGWDPVTLRFRRSTQTDVNLLNLRAYIKKVCK